MQDSINMCFICKSDAIVSSNSDGELYIVDCKRCGTFHITKDAIIYYERNKQQEWIPKISYWIRSNQSSDPKHNVDISLQLLRGLADRIKLPSPREQANNLLLWIGDNFPKPNDDIVLKFNELISVVGAYDAAGVRYVVSYLVEIENIFSKGEFLLHGSLYRGIISFNGWDRYYELQRSNKDSRLVFMAMKFGGEPLTTIYENVIKDAVSKTGFELRKLDEEKRAGLIDDKLRVEIRRSKFLIADLTHDNNGAYWEAGFAEGLGMPVIYICEEEKFKASKSHFDTNHHLTVSWKDESEALKKFADELKATIRATFPAEAKMED